MKFWSGVAFLLLIPVTGMAYGPGVHCREADRAVELMAEVEESWAVDMETPYARSYLRMGANAPDFQWASDSLQFGHSKELSYHLLESAQTQGPEARLFALGHLAHIAGDASAEVFVTPTLFASAPIGPMDLFLGDDGPKSESEAIVEGYGDLVNGDWEAVVETLWDLRLESPEAWERFAAVFTWYCETGNELYGNSNCVQALADMDERFQTANDLLGGADLEGAKTLIKLLVDQPLEALYDLYSTGLLSFLLGQESTLSDDSAFYETLFLTGPLVDPELWAIYDDSFADLAPRFTVDHSIHKVTGWPEYDGVSIISGNIQSLLQFLPEFYSPVPGLHVTDVRWMDDAGAPIDAVGPEHLGKPLRAHIRFFGALPFAGTVLGQVIQDTPGLQPDLDTWLGEGQVVVNIDPFAYTLTPQSLLEISFTVENLDGEGVYVELFTGEADLPWFTSSDERLWSIAELPMAKPQYRVFGTYDAYPHSLPFASNAPPKGSLLGHAHLPFNGPGISGAALQFEGVTYLTGANGIAAVPLVEPGEWAVNWNAESYLPTAATVAVNGGKPTWLDTVLTPVASPTVPASAWFENCVPVQWNTLPFLSHAEDFLGWIEWEGGTQSAPVSLGVEGQTELCPEEGSWMVNAPGIVWIQPVYPGENAGPKEATAAIQFDGTLPEMLALQVEIEDLPCEEVKGPMRPSAHCEITAVDEESGIQKIEIRWVDDEDWSPTAQFAATGKEATGTVTLGPGTPERNEFEIRLTNGLGAAVVLPGEVIPIQDPCPAERETLDTSIGRSDPADRGADTDTTWPDSTETESPSQFPEDEDTLAPGKGSNEGCRVSRTSGQTGWLFLSLFFFLLWRRKVADSG